MIRRIEGKVMKGLGGLYETRAELDGEIKTLTSFAKGNLKRDEEKLAIGDNVILELDDNTPDGIVIAEVLPRRNILIRPPIANLDYLFIVFAAKKPTPVLETVDKLTSIAIHNNITPVIVITKSDLGDKTAAELANIYQSVGIDTFITSSETGEGTEPLGEYIRANVKDGRTAAFAGASGVGKSTLMNALFPSLALATGDISHKIERGRHTTRHVELFSLEGGGFLADTPGFSLIDFARFDFFALDDLLPTFPELLAYVGECRYADCAHVGESADDCAVARAEREGKIPETRLTSYRSIYKVLKSKKTYE